MNHHEQRQLRTIEQLLESEDPEFTRRLRSMEAASRREMTGWTTAVVVVGPVVVLVGLPADLTLAVVGVLIAAAIWVRLLMSSPPPSSRACGPDDDGGPPPDSDRGAAV